MNFISNGDYCNHVKIFFFMVMTKTLAIIIIMIMKDLFVINNIEIFIL